MHLLPKHATPAAEMEAAARERMEREIKEKMKTAEGRRELHGEDFNIGGKEAEAERLRLSEAERLRLSEAERLRLSEAERLRLSEAERLRLSEAERLRLSEAERLRIAEQESRVRKEVGFLEKLGLRKHGVTQEAWERTKREHEGAKLQRGRGSRSHKKA